MECPRCQNTMALKIKDYLCSYRCEKVKNTEKRSREEHDYMLRIRESGFRSSDRLEYQEIYFLKTASERYWDKLWNGK